MTDLDLDTLLRVVADRPPPLDAEVGTPGRSVRVAEIDPDEAAAPDVTPRLGRIGSVARDELVRAVERQRNRMAAVFRLSEVLQEVDQAVIEQSTREEIDRLVCEHLVESGEYAAAWIGDVDLANERVVPRVVEGAPEELFDAVPFDAAGVPGLPGSATAGAATGERRVVRAGPDSGDTATFPAFARDRGYRSTTAVLLAYEDVRYGVLTLFSTRRNAFGDYESTNLEQLGRTVGHAINAIERKRALVGESFTQLVIRLPDAVESLDPSGDSGAVDSTITVEGTVATSDGRVIQYLSVTGSSPERFREAATGIDGVGSVRNIGGAEDSDRFEVTYTDPVITPTLASYGGRIETVGFDVPDLRVTVALPTSADVRQIVRSLRSEVPDLEVVARRSVTRAPDSTASHRDEIDDALTERQRTALMTAFFAGYFDWSRESTGEEVAETLGVSPSTFHQHLRVAQWKVFSELFEG